MRRLLVILLVCTVAGVLAFEASSSEASTLQYDASAHLAAVEVEGQVESTSSSTESLDETATPSANATASPADARGTASGRRAAPPKFERKDTCYRWERVRSLADQGFEPRAGHHSWLGADGRSVFVFGGCGHPHGSSRYLEHCVPGFSKFDLIAQKWQPLPLVDSDSRPLTSVVDGTSAAHDPHSGTLYLFGGRRRASIQGSFVQTAFSNTLSMLVKKRPAPGSAPVSSPSTANATAFSSASTNSTTATTRVPGSLPRLTPATTVDTYTLVNIQVDGTLPPASQDSALAYAETELLLFGGFSDSGFNGDLYSLGLRGAKAQVWSKVELPSSQESPEGRRGHTLTRLPSDSNGAVSFLMLGGTNGVKTFDDLWVLTAHQGNYSWSQPHVNVAPGATAPPPRAFHTATILDDRVYVLGGCATTITPAVCYSDLHVLNLKTWTWEQVPDVLAKSSSPRGDSEQPQRPRNPSPRRGLAAVGIPRSNRILYLGGCSLIECPGDVDPVFAQSATRNIAAGTGIVASRVNAGNVFILNTDAICKTSCVAGSYVDETPDNANAPATDDNYIGPHCACTAFTHGKFCQNTFDCPRGCSGEKGVCIKKKHGAAYCKCKNGFWGPDCATATCRAGCNGRGVCTVGPNPYIATKTGRANVGLINDLLMGLSDQAKAVAKDIWFRSQSHCACRDGFYGRDCSLEKQGPSEHEDKCPKQCSGHGLCDSTGQCQCQAGFAGADCSIQCAGGCNGHGVCTADGVCKCYKGFSGPDCSTPVCVNECSKNGVCKNGRCVCVKGYGGVSCEINTSCSGKGKFNTKKGRCDCQAGFGGPDCSRNVVCPGGCSSNGRCVEPFPSVDETRLLSKPVTSSGASLVEFSLMENEATESESETDTPTTATATASSPANTPIRGQCQCVAGWRGAKCDMRTCKQTCRNGFCNSEGACVCYPGWRGEACTISAPCPGNCTTATHGTCLSSGKCRCQQGWHGRDCSVPGCPKDCSKNGECREGQCYCKPGFGGFDCSKECPGKCNGRGVCVDGKCRCRPGFEGEDCSKLTPCPRSLTSKLDCSGHGFCFRAKKKCYCEPGWEGPDCSLQVGSCEANTCNGHGTCRNGKCYCDVGFSGARCEIANQCVGNCNSRGYCMHGRCHCYNGFEGPACERFTEDRSCPNKCSGNGFCMHGRCFCAKGYGGKDCSEPTGFCSNTNCSNNGVCKFGKCFCQPGSSGLHCEQGGCNPKCEVGKGVCILGSCHCNPGFTGASCAQPLTCPQGCSDKGVCILGTCACLPGFSGRDCSIPVRPELATKCPKDCSGRGVCREGKCVCAPGFDGLDCSIEQEASCPNNCGGEPPLYNQRGTCRFGRCFCKPGYSGDSCEIELSCSSDCFKNGVCHHGKCQCLPGYGGDDCRTLISADDAAQGALLTNNTTPVPNTTATTNTSASLPATFLDTSITVPPTVDATSVFAVVAATTSNRLVTQALPDALSSINKPCGPTTHGCSQRGLCVNGKCVCETGFTGPDCSIVLGGQMWHRCPQACNKRGLCLFGKCYCDLGFGGPACQDALPLPCPSNCTGNGICKYGKCYCLPGWTGDSCSTPTPCDVDCGAHGVCFRGQCVCARGFAGEYCQYTSSFRGARPGVPASTKDNDMTEFRFKQLPSSSSEEGGQIVDTTQSESSDSTSLSSSPSSSSTHDQAHSLVETSSAVSPSITVAADEATSLCPHDCGKGRCIGGRCYCEPGYSGTRCSVVVDPSAIVEPMTRLSVLFSTVGLGPLGADWHASPVVLLLSSFVVGFIISHLTKKLKAA